MEDVDTIDPILNSVLNHETQKTGGRVLIRVGDRDIDFSPAFTIYLATRDPTCQFTPALCSRVTFVNCMSMCFFSLVLIFCRFVLLLIVIFSFSCYILL